MSPQPTLVDVVAEVVFEGGGPIGVLARLALERLGGVDGALDDAGAPTTSPILLADIGPSSHAACAETFELLIVLIKPRKSAVGAP